jgi:hypothetical protein
MLLTGTFTYLVSYVYLKANVGSTAPVHRTSRRAKNAMAAMSRLRLYAESKLDPGRITDHGLLYC